MNNQNKNGSTAIGILIATVILVSGLTYFISSSVHTKNQQAATLQTAIADKFVVELTEIFRSLSRPEFTDYFLTRIPNVPLCAHIGILDRDTNTIWNPDPITVLPLSRLDMRPGVTSSNRYYQVQVVNRITLNVVPGNCGLTPALAGPLLADETYLVTVRVKWLAFPSGDERVLGSSTVIP